MLVITQNIALSKERQKGIGYGRNRLLWQIDLGEEKQLSFMEAPGAEQESQSGRLGNTGQAFQEQDSVFQDQ